MSDLRGVRFTWALHRVGPLLFSLFINDGNLFLDSVYHIFTDNLQLYMWFGKYKSKLIYTRNRFGTGPY